MLRIQGTFSIHPFFMMFQFISVYSTLAANLVFLSFKALEITESDEKESSEEGALIDVEAPDDEDICVD